MIILMCNNKSSKNWGLAGSLVGYQAQALHLLHLLLKDRNLSPGLINSGKDSDGHFSCCRSLWCCERNRRNGGAQNTKHWQKSQVRSWRIKLVWLGGKLFCGLWSLVLLPPLSSSVLGQCIQRPSRSARREPDWWTGRTASCGGGTRGRPGHPPWSGHPSRWPRSSQGRPSLRGFWPAGGWCTSHTESSAQRGEEEKQSEIKRRRKKRLKTVSVTSQVALFMLAWKYIFNFDRGSV